jgi:Tetratricopeptide repeat
LGRHDDALRHLREARDLADRVGGNWFIAGSRVQLGILAVLRGRLDEARARLEEALELSLAARSTQFVTLCLAGYAWLAFADGDPERAARLEGAAEGLSRRVGLRAWPHLLRVEAELVTQARQRLGAARFDQAFAAGSGLTQREAVAIVRDHRGKPAHTSCAPPADRAETAAWPPGAKEDGPDIGPAPVLVATGPARHRRPPGEPGERPDTQAGHNPQCFDASARITHLSATAGASSRSSWRTDRRPGLRLARSVTFRIQCRLATLRL